MNPFLFNVSGDLLNVSLFALYSDVGRGCSIRFCEATSSSVLEKFLLAFIMRMKELRLNVAKGCFGVDMDIKRMDNAL